jgi:hypothetical protein
MKTRCYGVTTVKRQSTISMPEPVAGSNRPKSAHRTHLAKFVLRSLSAVIESSFLAFGFPWAGFRQIDVLPSENLVFPERSFMNFQGRLACFHLDQGQCDQSLFEPQHKIAEFAKRHLFQQCIRTLAEAHGRPACGTKALVRQQVLKAHHSIALFVFGSLTIPELSSGLWSSTSSSSHEIIWPDFKEQ